MKNADTDSAGGDGRQPGRRPELTETAIGRAKRQASETGQRLEIADKGLPGLRLRVTPAGGAAWVLAMRDREGAQRRFPVGEYPALSIRAARERARQLRQSVRHDGADPIAEAREARALARKARKGLVDAPPVASVDVVENL